MANFEAHQQVIPVIDIHSLLEATDEINGVRDETVRLIGEACRHVGFFYIAGHQVPVDLQEEMVELSTIFFALPKDVKSKIDMKFGGKAWRGFFCVGDEFTSGIPDQKEGTMINVMVPCPHDNITLLQLYQEYTLELSYQVKILAICMVRTCGQTLMTISSWQNDSEHASQLIWLT